ncbi:MAG: hypothetical protein JXR73_22665 [Candidatus Omnitrophica bacterium]|nr:hypothetical protein [Candidatus Omnitrophota bacterium]
MLRLWALSILFLAPIPPLSAGENSLTEGLFEWTVNRPLISPLQRTDDLCYSIKDPSVVFFEGKWRLFNS